MSDFAPEQCYGMDPLKRRSFHRATVIFFFLCVIESFKIYSNSVLIPRIIDIHVQQFQKIFFCFISNGYNRLFLSLYNLENASGQKFFFGTLGKLLNTVHPYGFNFYSV